MKGCGNVALMETSLQLVKVAALTRTASMTLMQSMPMKEHPAAMTHSHQKSVPFGGFWSEQDTGVAPLDSTYDFI